MFYNESVHKVVWIQGILRNHEQLPIYLLGSLSALVFRPKRDQQWTYDTQNKRTTLGKGKEKGPNPY